MASAPLPVVVIPIVGRQYAGLDTLAQFAEYKAAADDDGSSTTAQHALPCSVSFRGCCYHPLAKLLLLCDPVACCVRTFDVVWYTDEKLSLSSRGQIGERGNTGGKFLLPVAVDVNNRGEIAVADAKLNRVSFFTGSGSALHYFGKTGSGRGEFRGICDVKFTALGHVAVVDSDNHRIQVMTTTGGLVLIIGRQGLHRGELNAPCALDIARNGEFFVCDAGNKRIQRFSAKGKWLASFGSRRSHAATASSTPRYDANGYPITGLQLRSVFDTPCDILLGLNGEVLVSDAGRQQVFVFSDSGACLHVLPTPSASHWSPIGLCTIRNSLVVAVQRPSGQQSETAINRLAVYPPPRKISAGRFQLWHWATLLDTISYLAYADAINVRLVSRAFHRACRLLRNDWRLYPLVPGHASVTKYRQIVAKATGRVAVVEAFAKWGLRIFKPANRIRKHVMDFDSGFQSAICSLFGALFFHENEAILRALFRFYSISRDKMEINEAGFVEIVTQIEEVRAGFLQWCQCPAFHNGEHVPPTERAQSEMPHHGDAETRIPPTPAERLKHVEGAHITKLNRLLTKLQAL